MEKIKNPDIVAALLAASVNDKLIYKDDKKDDSHNSDLIVNNSVEIFKSIFKQISHINNEIK